MHLHWSWNLHLCMQHRIQWNWHSLHRFSFLSLFFSFPFLSFNFHCKAINNCTGGGTNNCAAGVSTCTSTGPGTFTCACISGYSGNGISCTGRASSSSTFLWMWTHQMSCPFCQQSIIARMVSIIALLEPRLAITPDLERSPVLAMSVIMAPVPHALVSGCRQQTNVNRSKNVF